jgi:hypothetical protein
MSEKLQLNEKTANSLKKIFKEKSKNMTLANEKEITEEVCVVLLEDLDDIIDKALLTVPSEYDRPVFDDYWVPAPVFVTQRRRFSEGAELATNIGLEPFPVPPSQDDREAINNLEDTLRLQRLRNEHEENQEYIRPVRNRS